MMSIFLLQQLFMILVNEHIEEKNIYGFMMCITYLRLFKIYPDLSTINY